MRILSLLSGSALLAASFDASAVTVMHIGRTDGHSPNGSAAITNYIGRTQLNNSDTFSQVDVFYFDEHTDISNFGGREAEVRTAIQNGAGAIFALTRTNVIGYFLGTASPAENSFSSPSYTTTGSSHPIYTGSGLANGAQVTSLISLYDQSRVSYNIAGTGLSDATILTTSNGNAVTMIDNIGLGTIIVSGNEPLEGNWSSGNTQNRIWVTNAIEFAANSLQASVPGPTAAGLLALAAFALAKRRA